MIRSWRLCLALVLILGIPMLSSCERAPAESTEPSMEPSVTGDSQTAGGEEEAVDPTFFRVYEGDQFGPLYDIAMTPDSTLLAVGTTDYRQTPDVDGDILVLNLGLDGEILWRKTHGGNAFDQAICVEPVDDGYVILGETDSYGAGGRDLILMKIDLAGDLVWSKTFGGGKVEWAKDLLQRIDGSFILIGETDSFGPEDIDTYVIAVDARGEELWTRVLGEALIMESGSAGLEGPDGSLYVTAILSHPGGYSGNHRETRLYKLDSQGQEIWTRLLSGEERQAVNDMAWTADGAIAMVGMAERFGNYPGPTDFWMARVDPESGIAEWTLREGSQLRDDYGTALTLTPDGSLLSVGLGPSFPIALFTPEGRIRWVRQLGDDRLYGGFAVLALPDGSYVMPGLAFNEDSADPFDAVLVRITAEGRLTNSPFDGSEAVMPNIDVSQD